MLGGYYSVVFGNNTPVTVTRRTVMDTTKRSWTKPVVMMAAVAMLAGLLVMAGANRALAQAPAPGVDNQGAAQSPPPPPPDGHAYFLT